MSVDVQGQAAVESPAGDGRLSDPNDIGSLVRAHSDYLVKQIAVSLLADVGRVQTEQEVLADPQRIDIWFVPHPEAGFKLGQLGLLGRIVSEACILEVFQKTPNAVQLLNCVRKQLAFHHELKRREPATWAVAPASWVISGGRPSAAISSMHLTPMSGWPAGVYEAPSAFRLFLVITSELPTDLDSLIVRLLGARGVFRDAVTQLRNAPPSFPMRERLVRLVAIKSLEIRAKTERSTEEKEFLMNASELVAEYLANVRAEGRMDVLRQVRTVLLNTYAARFGTVPPSIRDVVEATADATRLAEWTALVASARPDEIKALLTAERT